MHPFVLDMGDTIARLGVTPGFTSADALRAMLEDR
jgi:hypothetical protein